MKRITPNQSDPRTSAGEVEALVSSKVVGRACGVHHRTIELHAQKGLLPHYRVGGSLRFNLREVLAAMRNEAAK